MKLFETKDPEKIVEFYHPQAVMIHIGRDPRFVKYGRGGKFLKIWNLPNFRNQRRDERMVEVACPAGCKFFC